MKYIIKEKIQYATNVFVCFIVRTIAVVVVAREDVKQIDLSSASCWTAANRYSPTLVAWMQVVVLTATNKHVITFNCFN